MRVAVGGSVNYLDKRKIKEAIFDLKKRFPGDLEIVSGGSKTGADKFTKKFTLEMDIPYKEFNPSYTGKNIYSALYHGYYGKPYHPSQFAHRNFKMLEYCDVAMFFYDDDINCKEIKQMEKLVKTAKKLEKPCIIIS